MGRKYIFHDSTKLHFVSFATINWNFGLIIISSEKGKLSDIIRDFKRHTAKELIKCIDSNDRESTRELILWRG